MRDILNHIEEIDEIIKKREEKPGLITRIAKNFSYKTLDAFWGSLGILGFVGLVGGSVITYEITESGFYFLIYFIMSVVVFSIFSCIALKSMKECVVENKTMINILKNLKQVMNDADGVKTIERIIEKREKLPRWWWSDLEKKIKKHESKIKDTEEVNELLDIKKNTSDDSNENEALTISFSKKYSRCENG